MIPRSRFIATTGGAMLALSGFARATPADTGDYDPATSATRQALRVLLGHGNAVAQGPDRFSFDGRTYRGTFSVAPGGAIVNLVDLEQYLYSVVPREMSPSWPSSAMQAQAICSRTYVLQRSNPRRAYDVVPSELDQVYGGYGSESPAARAAVDATAGSVLRFGDAFAYALYSSCCGGHTEASFDAWSGPPFAYLMGVVCPYCTASPYYRWQRTIPLSVIADAFASTLAPLGTLTDVRLGAIDRSGRARTIELDAGKASTFVKAGAFRLSVGVRTVPSLLITKLRTMDDAPRLAAGTSATLSLSGGGLGHGVGLCQWGARGMALAGHNAVDILAFYFPGTYVGHD
ncbi:MAG: SpoIID/LytB domain-containing protein [Vulcanimicrobiaceae bacterium]